MRLRPKKWTHHHTQRLYHASLLATWVAIILVILVGLVWVRFGAVAAPFSTSNSVNVSATVGQIDEGPSIVPSGGSSGGGGLPGQPAPTSTPGQLIYPFVKIFPREGFSKKQLVKSGRYAGRELDAFNTHFPEFNVQTNIPNAIVHWSILDPVKLKGALYGGKDGYTNLRVAESLDSGVYVMDVRVENEKEPDLFAETRIIFIEDILMNAEAVPPSYPPDIIIPTGENLFDVLVNIPDQFKNISPGEEIVANIRLINFGSAGHPVDAVIHYFVFAEDGTPILQASETMAVATSLSFLKSFTTNPKISEGLYRLTVKVPSEGVIAMSEDTFYVKGKAVIPLGGPVKVDFTIIIQALLALLFLFVLIAYFEYNKVSVLSKTIRQVRESDLKSLID